MDSVQPTHLLHLAWFAVPGQFWTSPENLRWVQASLELLSVFESVGGRRLVVAGSCDEYEWSDVDCDEHDTPLRPATLYGTCKHALHLVMALCTPGTQVRDFLHVADVAGAFVALLDSPVGGAVNIASGTPVSIANLVSTIGRQMGAASLVRLGARPLPAHEQPRLTARVARLRDEVGWTPTISLESGLEQTTAWWRSARSRHQTDA